MGLEDNKQSRAMGTAVLRSLGEQRDITGVISEHQRGDDIRRVGIVIIFAKQGNASHC